MDKITLKIGSIETGNNVSEENIREVQFTGEKLAEVKRFGIGRDGGLTDTRGTTEALYRAEDGRLLVHSKEWSRWQGEPTIWTLHQVTEAQLGPTGQYWSLGQEADFGRPLTLDEALNLEDFLSQDESE